jgi:dihydroneopterin aldolase/2-amino-4-hydroxy-6-hydroxymethyldihydropteridine diphosphokinase
MDKIYINDLEVYAYHGVNSEEKEMGQRFLISVELFLDLREAGVSDDLTKTINYAALCHEIEEEFKKEKHNLIECASEHLASYILIKYKNVNRVKLTLKKPWAPIGKPLKYAAIKIDRARHTAYIGIGANMGNKKQNIESALNMINNCRDTWLTKTSKYYETKPVGYLEQDDFLNCVIEINTIQSPIELMRFLLKIEKRLKRERKIRWGPRTIDLDILLYDDIVSSEKEIIIPHPRMHERMFVLEPLCDIAPYALHPLLNKRISTLKEELEGTE